MKIIIMTLMIIKIKCKKKEEKKIRVQIKRLRIMENKETFLKNIIETYLLNIILR
jgi:hypothetical protein